MSKDEIVMVRPDEHPVLFHVLEELKEAPLSQMIPVSGYSPEELKQAAKILHENYGGGKAPRSCMNLIECFDKYDDFDEVLTVLLQHAANLRLEKSNPKLWTALRHSLD
jgi:hypothetical protein